MTILRAQSTPITILHKDRAAQNALDSVTLHGTAESVALYAGDEIILLEIVGIGRLLSWHAFVFRTFYVTCANFIHSCRSYVCLIWGSDLIQ